MAKPGTAAHILAQKYPELTTDQVSRYVSHLKDSLGEKRASPVYSIACRSAPLAENPMGIQRGSVVLIEKGHYIVLGCGFMTIELASLDHPEQIRSIGRDEFARLGDEGFKVLSPEESAQLVESKINAN